MTAIINTRKNLLEFFMTKEIIKTFDYEGITIQLVKILSSKTDLRPLDDEDADSIVLVTRDNPVERLVTQISFDGEDWYSVPYEFDDICSQIHDMDFRQTLFEGLFE